MTEIIHTGDGIPRFRCPTCKKAHTFPSANVGGFRCSHCATHLTVPWKEFYGTLLASGQTRQT